MRFLSRLLSLFEGSAPQSSARFDEVPDSGEELTRFLFSKGHLSPKNNRVKPGGFLPSPDPLETSVFRMIGLGRSEIQRLGEEVGRQREQPLRAWGNVLAGVVFDIGLQVRPDNRPERHAAIVGWPAEKHEQLSSAQQLR
jgi:hypothetical protein